RQFSPLAQAASLQDPSRFPTPRVARAKIDLSLGREVPVTLEPLLAVPVGASRTPARPALAPGFNVHPSSLSSPKQREL
ncbi:MAG: hypothetical protein V4773_28435, partial [Verrucomicrobiota bacterium]